MYDLVFIDRATDSLPSRVTDNLRSSWGPEFCSDALVCMSWVLGIYLFLLSAYGQRLLLYDCFYTACLDFTHNHEDSSWTNSLSYRKLRDPAQKVSFLRKFWSTLQA